MLIILGIIVGAVLTYLLTSSKELRAYRRDRLEQCAHTINENFKTVDRISQVIVECMSTNNLSKLNDLNIDIDIDKRRLEQLFYRSN